ncbi:SRPBCC domain-containing protein [Arthrobacter sp. NPDC089319]|uniref:SRPBCC family protein n=1 Tax=Arthrobacter sp. NPDC089319 TaxID=3155915 RepID=UPI003421AA59
MNERSSGHTLELESVLEAPYERVFRMLTEPAELVKWWGPAGFTTPEATLDPRPGGSYRLTMQPPDGEPFHLAGEFLEVDPPRRLVYTFRWEEPTPDDRETTVILSLAARAGQTWIALTQGEFATEERLALHRDGWTDALGKLAEVVRAGA